jgi:hypothetical protein
MRRAHAGLILLLLCSSTSAETDDWLFPDAELLPTLKGGARDPVTQGQFVYSWNNPTAYGPGAAGEVSISQAAPVFRLAGTSTEDALVVGLEGAAFARFSLQVVTRELVNTDWVFAVPLVWHRGEDWLRLRYYHTSSHLGDEYQRRFGPSSVNFSRDGADLTGYVRPYAGVGLYALSFWSVNSHPEESQLWEFRGGIEYDPDDGVTWRPFFTADIHVEEGTGWTPRWTLQAGLWMPKVQTRPLSVLLQVIEGPSPMGQFRERNGGQVSLGLIWNP